MKEDKLVPSKLSYELALRGRLFYFTIKLSRPAPVPMNFTGQPNYFFYSIYVFFCFFWEAVVCFTVTYVSEVPFEFFIYCCAIL